MDAAKHPYHGVKRLMDIVLSAAGLVILLIPFLLVAVIIYIDDPGNILFRQDRIGRAGKPFRMIKFRSMKMNTPHYLSAMDLDDPDQYSTRVGRILRRLSIDELPQLLNVLRGDMSLVGPRPLIPNEQEIHEMRMRLGVYSIRPGVTGLAQINGREALGPAEKVRWDVCYLAHFGLWTDIRILFATIPALFRVSGR